MKRYVNASVFCLFLDINRGAFFFLVDTHPDKTGTLVLIKETILHK